VPLALFVPELGAVGANNCWQVAPSVDFARRVPPDPRTPRGYFCRRCQPRFSLRPQLWRALCRAPPGPAHLLGDGYLGGGQEAQNGLEQLCREGLGRVGSVFRRSHRDVPGHWAFKRSARPEVLFFGLGLALAPHPPLPRAVSVDRRRLAAASVLLAPLEPLLRAVGEDNRWPVASSVALVPLPPMLCAVGPNNRRPVASSVLLAPLEPHLVGAVGPNNRRPVASSVSLAPLPPLSGAVRIDNRRPVASSVELVPLVPLSVAVGPNNRRPVASSVELPPLVPVLGAVGPNNRR